MLEDSDNAYVHSLPFGTGGESGPTLATRMGNHPGNPSEKHLVEMDQAEQGLARGHCSDFRNFGRDSACSSPTTAHGYVVGG